MKYPPGKQERLGIWSKCCNKSFCVKYHPFQRMIRGEQVTWVIRGWSTLNRTVFVPSSSVPGHGVGLGGVHDVFLLLPGHRRTKHHWSWRGFKKQHVVRNEEQVDLYLKKMLICLGVYSSTLFYNKINIKEPPTILQSLAPKNLYNRGETCWKKCGETAITWGSKASRCRPRPRDERCLAQRMPEPWALSHPSLRPSLADPKTLITSWTS